MARSLWIYPRRAGPEAEEKQEDDQGGQADRKTDRRGGRVGEGGSYGAGTSPAGALAHVPCCHTKGGSIRVGLKDGGKRERYLFFFCFFFLTNNCVSRLCSGRGDWGGSVRVGAPIRRSHTPRCEKAGRCTYMVKPPGFFFFFSPPFPPPIPIGAGAPIW